MGPGEKAIHKTWKSLEAGELLETATVIPQEAWRLEQETEVILAVVGRREADRLGVELRGVGDGFYVEGEGKGVKLFGLENWVGDGTFP